MAQRKEKVDILAEASQLGSEVKREGKRMEAAEEGFARLTLRLPKSLWRAVKVYAAQNDTTIQNTIIDLLREFLKRKGINPEDFVSAGRGKAKKK